MKRIASNHHFNAQPVWSSLPCLCLALSVASCTAATETETTLTGAQELTQIKDPPDPGDDPPTPPPDPTHAQQLAAQSIVMFTHDHVRNTDSAGRAPHFQDALAGGMTAMTLELTVDNVQWKKGDEVFGPVGSGAVQTPVNMSAPNESAQSGATRFSEARTALENILLASGGQVRLVRTVQDIDAAKANGQLGIIIGTEGSIMLGDDTNFPGADDAGIAFGNVELRYSQGWRKTQLYRVYETPYVSFGDVDHVTPLGQDLVRMLNKRGVIVDGMHLRGTQIDDLFRMSNAPLQVSHDWADCGYAQAQLDEIVASGGGHGVISINALTSNYTICGHNRSKDIHGFVGSLMDTIAKVGVDHVGIGPDYQPEGGNDPADPLYALSGIEGTPLPIVALTSELLSRGLSDTDIKKILGGNIRDLYQRIWDPTHGYDGGAAHFRLCSNTDTSPACVAARSNSGQGDLRHRAINCGHPSGLTPVGTHLAYLNDQWMFRNLANAWVPCSTDPQGLALVVSWGDGELQNGRIALHGTPTCDANCQQATTWAGAGTANARALSCQSATSNGVVGLQLVYTATGWHFYDIAGQLQPCLPGTTLIANWGSAGVPNANAKTRLCDDYNNDPACAAAASYAGNGTAEAKVMSCLSSTPWDYGTTSLQVFYSDKDFDTSNNPTRVLPEGGHWRYWGIDGKARRCLHGSVLVATTL